MFERIDAAVTALEAAVGGLDPACVDGHAAARLVEVLGRGERICAAGKALNARRVDDANVWIDTGHRSAAHWLAATTGTTVGAAIDLIDTARHLDGLGATAAAFRAGELSELQAREITGAASLDPHAEADLLAAARTDGVRSLRERCRRVKAAATSQADQDAANRRIHRDRYHRSWTDHNGAYCYQGRTTPERGAVINAAIHAYRDPLFRAARATGRREPWGAHAVDALAEVCAQALAPVSLGEARRGYRAPLVTALLRIDASVLRNGCIGAGEVCELAGIGPVPVATARELLGDALLRIVLTDGVDVRGVVHVGRTVRAPIRTALEWLYPHCSVVGCNHTQNLEHHHLHRYTTTRTTNLDELVALCRHHHDLVTYRSYRLEPRPDGEHDLIFPARTSPGATSPPATAPADSPPTVAGQRGPPRAA